MSPTNKHHLIGTTTVGEKGQVVIPANIREELQLKKGEKLIVFAREGGLGLIRPKTIEPMIKQLTTLSNTIKQYKKK